MSATSNYLYNVRPGFYGGQQAEYLELAEKAIEAGTEMIKSAVGAKKDPTAIFFEVMDFFQKERRKIAEKHENSDAPDADLFGTLRTSKALGAYFATTPLAFDYAGYNSVFKKQLKGVLSEMQPTPGGFLKKKHTKEETVFGRRILFRVEILDTAEMVARIQGPSDKELQELLGTDKTCGEIKEDSDLLRKLKQKNRQYYNAIALNTFVTDFLFRFGTELKGHLVRGTLYVEIDKKPYAMSDYLSSFDVDGKTDPVQAIVQNSKTLITHHDTFLIDETLVEISKIFKEAVVWDRTKDQELKDRIAFFRFMYTYCQPCVRGVGAIGDWFELALYRYHGFTKTHFNDKRLPCFEALASISLSRFLTEYDKITTVIAPTVSVVGS